MKREHKPLEMIHAEWHDVKSADKETRVKWLIKHQKMMLPYDINWEKLNQGTKILDGHPSDAGIKRFADNFIQYIDSKIA